MQGLLGSRDCFDSAFEVRAFLDLRFEICYYWYIDRPDRIGSAMRPLRFVGDSLEVLRELPEEVKNEVGFALERVQRGKMPENAKPLKGIAPGVLEIISDFRGDTFRAVYAVKFVDAVYVLHVF